MDNYVSLFIKNSKSISVFIKNQDFTGLLKLIVPIFKCAYGEILFLDRDDNKHSFYYTESTKLVNKELESDISMKKVNTGISGYNKDSIVVKNRIVSSYTTDAVLLNVLTFLFHNEHAVHTIMQLGHREKPFKKEFIQLADFTLNYFSSIFLFAAQNKKMENIYGNKISNERISSLQYKSVFDGSRDLIYISDPHGIIININKNGATILGADSPEQLIGKNIQSFYLEQKWNIVFINKLKEKGFVQDFEVIINTFNDEKLYFIESSHISNSPTGDSVLYIGILKNISHRIQAEKELWQMNIQLEKANDLLKQSQQKLLQNEKLASIGQLAAGVAHELNNPLGFIQTNINSIKKYLNFFHQIVSNLESSLTVEERTKYFDMKRLSFIREDMDIVFEETREGVHRMITIVNNLNVFSRTSKKDDFFWVDINKSISSALVLAKSAYKYFATVKVKSGDVPKIYCNDGQIKQVLLNVMVNAAQALEEKGYTVESGIIEIESYFSHGYAHIVISDNGPGIPEEKRTQVLDPFFTTKDPGKGTGLGLSISNDIIVRTHNGLFKIASSKYDGAKFIIMLPEKYGDEEEL